MSNDLLPNRGFITAGKATVNNVGLFLQDEWTLGSRLTLQVGLRTENEHVPSLPATRASADRDPLRLRRQARAAPGPGLGRDGDHKTKVYGSWGVFYDITKLGLSLGFGASSSVASS